MATDAPVRRVPRDRIARRVGLAKQIAARDDVLAVKPRDNGHREIVVALDHEDGLPDHILSTIDRIGYNAKRETRSVYRLVARAVDG